MTMKMVSVNNEASIATWYLAKKQSANDRNIEFNLSLMSFINMAKAKRCYYTGVTLTIGNRTIDRIDASKGYIPGNVVACCKTFNQFKGVIENSINSLDLNTAIKGLVKAKIRIDKLD